MKNPFNFKKGIWIDILFYSQIFLVVSAIVLLLGSCTKDYNITIEDNKPLLKTYLSAPTSDCPGGEFHIEYSEGGVLFFEHIECLQKGESIVFPECPLNAYIYYIRGECDTLLYFFDTSPPAGYNYGDSVIFKFAICDNIIIIQPDTVYVPYPVHDTVYIEGHSFAREFFRENFNNPGNSPYYLSIGWIKGQGFSFNGIGSSTGNGTIVLWHDIEIDTLWSPELFSEPMDIDSLSIYIGSLNSYLATPLVMNSEGNIYAFPSVNSFSEDFDWQDISTYIHVRYSTSPINTEYRNIIKWGLCVRKQGTFFSNTRNEKFNSDNFFIRGVKIVN